MATIREALNAAMPYFTRSSSPILDARLLLCDVLHVNAAHLAAYPDRQLTDDQYYDYMTMVARRSQGEPIAYILGMKSFYDVDLKVSPAVLIPRPETEHLVEEAINFGKTRTNLTIADIGTGSGAIAVAVGNHLRDATLHATDISADALAIAKENANTYSVNVTFHEGDLAQPLLDADIKVNMLLANLPYIRSDGIEHLEVAKHEPILALDGGEDGLDLIHRLLKQAKTLCQPGALILFEISVEQGARLLEDVDTILAPKEATIIKDYAQRDRVLKVVLN